MGQLRLIVDPAEWPCSDHLLSPGLPDNNASTTGARRGPSAQERIGESAPG
jgi:hypothetical protein